MILFDLIFDCFDRRISISEVKLVEGIQVLDFDTQIVFCWIRFGWFVNSVSLIQVIRDRRRIMTMKITTTILLHRRR